MNIRLERPETIKLLEENIGDTLLDVSLGDIIFLFDSKINGNKSKNKQMGWHQTKVFCIVKKNINKVQRQPTKWEKLYIQ